MKLNDALLDWLEHLEIEQNRSPKTITNYHHYLTRFADFAGDIEVSKIDGDLVRKWRLWLNRLEAQGDHGTSEPISRTTQNYHLIALRSFLRYLAKRDIKTLASDKVELAKVVRPQVSFLNPEDLARLLEAPDLTKVAGLRDRAILELLFSSGLRVSELFNLNRGDINLKTREFIVRGKGQKDRPVFISEQATNWLRQYLARRTDNYKPLFVHISGSQSELDEGNHTRLTPRSIQRLVSKYAKRAGILKSVTPHTLRHSFATDLLRNGADLRSVQALLGHSNVATTQIYTHITDPQLKQVHDKFHRKTEEN